MAISITKSGSSVMGNKRVRWGTGNLGTYVAGGIAVSAANLGLSRRIDHLEVSALGATAAGATSIALKWDRTNGKIQAFHADVDVLGTPQDLAEIPGADRSTLIFNWQAMGV